MTLTWKPGYTTGVEKLDEQHRELFELLNQLEGLIARGVHDGPELDRLLRSLGSHTTRHFSDEEGCMDRARCPMALKNKQEHEQFLGIYADFMSRFNEDRSVKKLLEFHASAEAWVLEHVAFVDIHLRPCVAAGD